MSLRDVDRIIAELRQRLPDVSVEQLKVLHPGADDDGLWFFNHSAARYEVQLESSDGMLPFLLESDGDDHCDRVTSIDQAVDGVVARLGLQGSGPQVGV